MNEKDRQIVYKKVKQLEALSIEFKTCQCVIFDQTEDQGKLIEEQIALGDHEDEVEHLKEHTEDQVVATEHFILRAFGTRNHPLVVGLITEAEHLGRRLNYAHRSLVKVEICGRQ